MKEGGGSAGSVKLQGEVRCVSGEIVVTREDGPVESHSHGADQEVDARAGDAGSPATIAGLGCFLIVPSRHEDIVKRAQVVSQSTKLRVIAYARKNLLTDGTYQLGGTSAMAGTQAIAE